MRTLVSRATVILAALLVAGTAAVVSGQDEAKVDLPVEVLPIPELPLSVASPILTSKGSDYVLKCQLVNNSASRLVEFTYVLLVQDQNTSSQMMSTQTVTLKLAPSSTKDVTLETPRNFKIKSGARVILMVQEVVNRKWLWAVINSREVLKAFAKDSSYVAPEVKKVLNQVDSSDR